ncbi:host specificity protein J [Acidovorax sp.]|uniref:host specificity protein J n=1 Tax=Acidovorax sp. TaxID=1872122 RepID=UPI00391EE539
MATNKNNKPLIPQEIKGEGGKGGGGARSPIEAENTLRSAANVRVLELISEGEIEGLVNGLESVYLNDTPVQAQDGSMNYPRVVWDERFGMPSQSPMPGFPSTESEKAVNTEITTALSPSKATSEANIDAVRLTIALPNGLNLRDDKTGDLNGNTVTLAIDRRSQGGTWQQVGGQLVIEGKATRAYEKTYYVARPNTSNGIWEVRVRRLTPDSTSTLDISATVFSRITEINEVQLEYANSAYVGLSVDAESVGDSIPHRSYLVRGIKCAIPQNYNPLTRQYTGTWNGAFKYEWTNNPAWVLFDLLTNNRYGLGGDDLTEDDVDKWSFYRAAKYNDELVPDGSGGHEPRFTFDSPITVRGEAYKLLQMVAGAMRAMIVFSGGLITLCQDRPGEPVKLVSNSNVIGGKFTYSSSAKGTRYTAANITWNDKNDRYLPKVYTLEDGTAFDKYGYNLTETAAYGATSLGQAMRAAKWTLYTAQNQDSIVSYETSLAQFDLKINDIIKVYDEFYTSQAGQGRIVSATTNSVTLNQPVTITAGSKIDIVVPAGEAAPGEAAGPLQYVTMNVTNQAGSHTVLNLSSSFAVVPKPGASFMVTSAISPRLFRVLRISQDSPGIMKVEAVFHDPAKYAYVENGLVTTPPVYGGGGIPGSLSKPRNLQVQPTASVFEGRVQRNLVLSWDAPQTGTVSSYIVKHRYNNGSYRTVTDIRARTFDLNNVEAGLFDFSVQAMGVNSKVGPAESIQYTYNLDGVGTSALDPVTTLRVVGGGTEFYDVDLNFEFMNPLSNRTKPVQLKDFEIQICRPDTQAVLRTAYVPAVAPGSMTSFAYTYTLNSADTGGPRRSVLVKVRARDVQNNVSGATTATFSNSPPATVQNFYSEALYIATNLTWTANSEKDLQGYHIWRASTPNFIPSESNHISSGLATSLHTPVPAGVTYYYKIAAYDKFTPTTDRSGNGLNFAIASSTGQKAPAGVPGGYGLPTSGNVNGDTFFNIPDNRLYTYNNGTWKGVGILTGSSFPSQNNADGDLFVSTNDNKLYRYGASGWTAMVPTVPAVSIQGQLTSSQIASIEVAKLTGKLGSYSELFSGKIFAADIYAGTLTGNQMAANTITGNLMAANSVTSSSIAANAVTSAAIAADAITAGKIQAGSIDSYHILANSITAGKIAAYSIGATHMQANTITAGSGIIGALAVDSIQIANGAVSTVYSSTSSGSYTSLTAYVPPNARSFTAMAFYGVAIKRINQAGEKGPEIEYYYTSPAYGNITGSGGEVTNGFGAAAWSYSDPPSQYYSVAAQRFGSDTGVYRGSLTLVVIVTHK